MRLQRWRADRHEGASQIKQLLGLRNASEISVGFTTLLPG
ncbi:hypothetical protein XHC_3733 [Xanthomonas hortorum pv. carotae str. M081]|nr:hypothetical protein XHC_3733 [Xanthomonas hortorum pv. carotae str. M081]